MASDLELWTLAFFAMLPIPVLLFIPVYNSLKSKRPIDVFEPPFVLAGLVFIGTTVRTLFLAFDPNADREAFRLVGLYDRFEILPYGAATVLIGVTMWTIGYYINNRRLRLRSQNTAARPLNERAMWQAIFGVGAVGLVLSLLYLNQINFFSNIGSLGVSAKRLFFLDEREEIATTLGHLRMGSDFIAIATLTAYVFLISKNRLTLGKRVMILGGLLLACLVPFAASSRVSVLYYILLFVIARHYALRRISMPRLSTIILLTFILLGFLETLRHQSNSLRRGETLENVTYTLDRSVKTFAYNAHFVGVGKTSVIVTQMPSREPFLLGSSYLALFVAPIPRTLWPEKPVVRIGRFVGVDLYQRPSDSGVPPGLIGEAYLNFGWVGVFLIPFIFGLVCKAIYVSFVLRAPPDDVMRRVAFVILWFFMIDMMYTDFVGSSMRMMRTLLPFLVIVAATRMRSKADITIMRPVGSAA